MSKIAWRGRYACQCLIDLIADYEKATGKRVTTWQASYSNGSLSAGTHTGGGAWDGASYSEAELRELRRRGAFASHRTPAQGFEHHCHLVISGCPHLAGGAKYQVSEYRAGRNGLANRRADDGPGGYRQVTWKSYKEAVRLANLAKSGKVLVIMGKPHKPITTMSVKWVNVGRASGATSRHVYWLQVWLRKVGYYKGPLDGRWGKVTQAALDNFRKAKKLSRTTGSVGIESLTLLHDLAGSKLKVAK